MLEKTISPQDLNPPAITRNANISLEEIISALIVNREAVDDIRYTRGEWVVYAEQKHGKNAIKDLARETGIRKKDLQEAKNVVLAFPKSVREEFKKLSYKHLRLIQQKFDDPAVQMEWVTRAHDENLSCGMLGKKWKEDEPQKPYPLEKFKKDFEALWTKAAENLNTDTLDEARLWTGEKLDMIPAENVVRPEDDIDTI